MAILSLWLWQDVRAQANFDTVCWTDRPAIVEGESVRLRALSSTPDAAPRGVPARVQWHVDAGRLLVEGDRTEWLLEAPTVPVEELKRVVNATVTSMHEGSTTDCVVQVIVTRAGQGQTPDTRSPAASASLLSGRLFLIPGERSVHGYGLYSYLLFSAEPRDAAQRLRYLKTIEASLSVLPDIQDLLSRHVRRPELNLTSIPVTAPPERAATIEQWALRVLERYDYATAKILLQRLRQPLQVGPYLVSSLSPLDGDAGVASAHLLEDLSGVAPDVTWEWVRLFEFLAAGQRTWSEVALQRLGVKLRNVLSVGGVVTKEPLESLKVWIFPARRD